MANIISANELKTRGVKLLEEISHTESGLLETIVSVRGKAKYAILSIEYYNKLRELELEMALKDSLEDVKEGRYKIESAGEHLKNISK